MPSAIQDLSRELDELAASALSTDELMTLIVGRLKERLPHYDWVGFYMIETAKLPGEQDMLLLGPYVGRAHPLRFTLGPDPWELFGRIAGNAASRFLSASLRWGPSSA